MPGSVVAYANANIINAAPVNNTETIIGEIDGVSDPFPGWRKRIQCSAAFVTGTTTSSVTFRIRRGTLVTSPQVGQSFSIVIAGGVVGTLEVEAIDTAAIDGGSYVVTYQSTGATANAAITAVNTSVTITPT